MSAEGPSEPETPNPEAPVAAPAPTPEPAADAAAPNPEAVPSPGTKRGGRKLDRAQDDSEMERALMRTKIDEMDRAILDLQTQIGKEKDTGKQARLRDKLAEKVDERKQAHAEYKEMIKSFDAKLAEIQTLKGEIDALKELIQANESTHDAEEIRELADNTRTLDDKEKALKKLIPGGNLGDVEATLEAYQEERKDIRFEEARREKIGEADRVARLEEKEREQADKDLEVSLAEIFGETPPVEVATPVEPAKPVEAAAPNPGEPALSGKEKELILDNRIDQMAFDLAKLLATNVPTDTDTYGQFTFQAKRGLLMVLSYCGGDPAWTEQLTEKEKKDLGMTVFPKTDAEGNVLHTIKWEPLDFSLNKVQNVYEVAFGKKGWTKEMGVLTPKTTVKELQDRAANFDEDTKVESEVALKKFIETLLATGATPESGVQEFVAHNSDKIIKVYKPETATTSSEAGTQGKENAEFNADDVVRVIGEKKFHKKTSVKEVMNGVDPKWVAPAELSAADITKKASSIVDGFKTEGDLTVYQTSFKEAARAAAMLGLPDPSKALEPTFATALAELKAGKLQDATKAELQQGIETQVKLMQEYLSQPFYSVLEKEKPSATGQDLADVEKVMAALDKNSVPGTPAPEASVTK